MTKEKKYDLPIAHEYFREKGVYRDGDTKKICLPGGQPIEDRDKHNMRIELERKHHVGINKERFNMLLDSNLIPTRYILKEWLDDLRQTAFSDEFDRLVDHFTTSETDQAWFRRCLELLICGIIASIQGNPTRYIFVLHGKQHTGKTEFFLRLLPQSLRERYVAVSNLTNKYDELLMAECLLLVMDEWRALAKLDNEHFKSLSSLKKITINRKYEKEHVNLVRRAVLVGTSNSSMLVNDSSGNTRVVGMEVLKRNFKLFDAIDKYRLFAWALHRVEERGEASYTFSNAELKVLEKKSEAHQLPNPYREEVDRYFRRMTAEEESYHKGMTASEVANHINMRTSHRLFPQVMGKELLNMGYRQHRGNGRFYNIWPYPIQEGKPVPDDDRGDPAPSDDQENGISEEVPF